MNKPTVYAILGIAIVIAAIILATDFFGDQKPRPEITFDTASSSGQYFELQSELPAEDLLGANVVRSFITWQNDEFITRANQEGPDVAETRGEIVQFTQDVQVETVTTEKFISYRIEVGSYTGGANANSMVETFVFDQKGERLTNRDLIRADQVENFMVAVRNELAANENTFPKSGENVSFLDLNLYVTEEQVEIYFSEYEVGPGAAGIISITLPRDPYLSE